MLPEALVPVHPAPIGRHRRNEGNLWPEAAPDKSVMSCRAAASMHSIVRRRQLRFLEFLGLTAGKVSN